MTTVTKEKIVKAIDELPQEIWDELWLLIEFLKFKSRLTDTAPQVTEKITPKPEGAFPELDLSYEAIEASLATTQQKRQARLLPEL
jgi:hypothetical protein